MIKEYKREYIEENYNKEKNVAQAKFNEKKEQLIKINHEKMTEIEINIKMIKKL